MWNDTFSDIFRDAVVRYHEGHRTPEIFFTEREAMFLASTGHKFSDLYHYIEDYAINGEPSPTTILLIASVRRDFFLTIQKGQQTSEPPISSASIPAPGELLSGTAYLPRLIAKAQAFLKGTLPPDIMYYCSLDRSFLQENGNIHPADFLRIVWAAKDDALKIANFIKEQIPG